MDRHNQNRHFAIVPSHHVFMVLRIDSGWVVAPWVWTTSSGYVHYRSHDDVVQWDRDRNRAHPPRRDRILETRTLSPTLEDAVWVRDRLTHQQPGGDQILAQVAQQVQNIAAGLQGLNIAAAARVPRVPLDIPVATIRQLDALEGEIRHADQRQALADLLRAGWNANPTHQVHGLMSVAFGRDIKDFVAGRDYRTLRSICHWPRLWQLLVDTVEDLSNWAPDEVETKLRHWFRKNR
ncbi:uncharacterized protein LOC130677258 [Microplitis mediator]|uniref:uncharacterized protein LOC130677258 n=1 Tax=Microplitis mediator TaxID=375433 RepID=UPI002555526B|nr:uncharacterized protein LOC130677258 [Microplitis mediator]